MQVNKARAHASCIVMVLTVCCAGSPNLGGGYFIRDGKVHQKLKDSSMRVDRADAASFKYLAFDYTADKNGVYWCNDPIAGADAQSFVVLSAQYTKDKGSVYFLGTKIDGADPSTFKSVAVNHGADAKSVFFERRRIDGADPSTFEVLTQAREAPHRSGAIDLELMIFARDARHGYARGTVLEGADPKRLRLLGFQYIADDRYVYYGPTKLEADAGGFVVKGSDDPFAVDTLKNKAFVAGREFAEVQVDAKTFQLLGKGYYKDASAVYFYHSGRDEVWKVEGADASTFVVPDKFEGGDARDRSRRYFMGQSAE